MFFRNIDKEGVNFEELARSTEDFNGAMLKAVCVEAGMLAMRRDAACITHEDFVEGVAQVQMKKKQNLQVCCAVVLLTRWACLCALLAYLWLLLLGFVL
jgi:SpoVK/Ycf46/Vps4 family AAA+-type ATPase